MTTVKDIERGISSLPLKELAEFRAWFEEFDAQAWDKQFEEDAKSGRLDKAAQKAIEESVAKTTICHPELVSGSHNTLILLDAETSSA